MRSNIPSPVLQLIRDRRALLWVCQPFDLKTGQQPHDYGVPAADAGLRYRSDVDEADTALAAYFWEAVWLEGAASPVLKAMRLATESQPSAKRRSVVLLASQADADAQVSAQRFLPVHVMPGLLAGDSAVDARYGTLRARARERVAWDLRSRLEQFPRRALIVVGSRDPSDLAPLYEVLEDRPVVGLKVLLVWPGPEDPPSPPDNSAIDFHVFQGDLESFLNELTASHAPAASDLPRWAIRVGSTSVELPTAIVDRITQRFALITERDLVIPDSFSLEDLGAFFSGSLSNWKAYAVGAPVERTYVSEAGRSFTEEVTHALEHDLSNSKRLTYVLQLPCSGGAGGTTLLRTGAFAAARAGHPTLVMRPEATDLDTETLLAFTIAVSEACLEQRIDDIPAFVIVIDVEHSLATNVQQIPQLLAAHARRALIIKATEYDPSSVGTEKRTRNTGRLRHLEASIDTDELKRCELALRKLAEEWSLPLDIPTIDQWRVYQAHSVFRDPTGQIPPASLFWVALRYFLTGDREFRSTEQFQDALGAWIDKRMQPLEGSPFLDVVTLVATLSSFRIASPLWTVLRPITGGTFSSDLVSVLRDLEDLVTWGDRSDDLGDLIVRFAHPALAQEFLRRRGVRSMSDRVDALASLLSGLSPGQRSDMWVAESLASFVFSPKYEGRYYTDWDWRLSAFDLIAPIVATQSKTILHHWARCLYLSASMGGADSLPSDVQEGRFQTAIAKLNDAIQLPRRPGRTEHPSHLYNTLGTALSRYARSLERDRSRASQAQDIWRDACDAFEEALALMPGANVEALVAFGHRLLQHAKAHLDTKTRISEAGVEEVAKALSLFDEADQALDEYAMDTIDLASSLHSYRVDALALLNTSEAREYIERLKTGENADIGFYCEARLLCDQQDDDTAIALLQSVFESDVSLGPRAIGLLLLLMRHHPRLRFDFEAALRLHQRLEQIGEYTRRPLDAFRHAVLCYQTGGYDEGRARFQEMRAQARRSETPPPRVRDILRDSNDPTKPRIMHVRVTQFVTEWRADGHVEELGQTVPVRPRHFSPPLKRGDVEECGIRLEFNGPLAVPRRFVEQPVHRRRGSG